MRRLYLKLSDGKLVGALGEPGETADRVAVINTRIDLKCLLEGEYTDIPIVCSSSLDFPEEYTEDQSVIDLCNWIREGDTRKECTEQAIAEVCVESLMDKWSVKLHDSTFADNPGEWHGVYDDLGVVAYFRSIRSAKRFRLAEINRLLHG